jgi:molybdenum cofactor cytidylyltransferase
VVLAAGMSTRMGVAKQLLRIGDETLLEAVLDLLRSSRVDDIVVVLGGSAEAIQQQVPLDGARVVINDAYQQGMGTSLRVGVSAVDAASHGVLVVLADQPFVQPDTINRLIDQYHARKPQAAIPVYKGFRGNPVLLDRSLFPEIMTLAGDLGCRAIFGSHTNILKVDVDDIGVLLDIDTQADLERFEQAHRQGNLGSELLKTADIADRSVVSPLLIVVGDDAVARALAKFAKILHFDVTLVDPFLTVAEVPDADRVHNARHFPQWSMNAETYVVVASRGKFDEDAVEQALMSGAKYVALMANKKRGQEILGRLRAKGLPDQTFTCLRAPAGLKIGAQAPEEIALSVMAEIVSEYRSSAGQTG